MSVITWPLLLKNIVKRQPLLFLEQVNLDVHGIAIITGIVWIITGTGLTNLDKPQPLTEMGMATGFLIQGKLQMGG